MKIQSVLTLLMFTVPVFAQVTITGTVKNKQGETLPGVNIYIEGTYNGTSSDSTGRFSFQSDAGGNKYLVASYIGYQQWRNLVSLLQPQQLTIILKKSINTIDAVTITAGSFAAADQKRAAVMEPLDIYTTASANGDVMAAIRTLPGTQASPDDGRLMVRGGDAYESKTYIDGLLAADPYFFKTPDVATRGRFTPSLFNGVQFNSGGYSAEYGQALSSILELNSTGVASSSVFGISLMSIGVEGNVTKAFPKSSIMLSGGYTNMGLYNTLFQSTLDWTKPVESGSYTSAYRYKPTSAGLLKAFINADYGSLGYRTTEEDGTSFNLSNKGGNIYSNINYHDCLSENICSSFGVSSTYDADQTGYNQTTIDTKKLAVESRLSITCFPCDGLTIKAGLSDNYSRYEQQIITDTSLFSPSFTGHILGSYAETEIKFNKYVAIRPGARGEYSTLLNQITFSPRFAMALKTGKKSQLSAAWGQFYQNPENDYLKYNTKLEAENATHYIVSFQSGEVSDRLFRTELYYKNYHNLVTWEGNNSYIPRNIKNNGKGYAKGIDIFWRDKKTIRHLEYWLTYSYIDTKRLYQNYPEMAKPDFISDHTFSFVSKYWVNKISTQFGSSFIAASSRNYDDSSTDEFMDMQTGWYTNLCLNMSHVFFIGRQYSVLYVSLTNVLGSDNILSYRPSTVADAEGNYTLTPICRDMKRFLFVGLFLNL